MITKEMKEEILKLKSIATYSDVLFGREIAKEIGFNDITEDMLYILGCIYKYGKIQGIREERAKRKAKLIKEVI